MSKRVALVIETKFGEKLISLANLMPVWIVESPENQDAVDKAWHHGLAVTTFDIRDGELCETACERIVQSLDDHHNEFSQNPGYSELECIGVTLANVSLESFIELGFNEFLVTSSGFLTKK